MANECLILITEANAGRLTDDELEVLIQDLSDTKKMHSGNEGIEAIEAAMFRRGQVIADDIMLEALNKKRMALKNILIEEDIMRMTREADDMIDDPIMGLKARMGGINAPIKGAQNSTGARSRAIQDSLMGGIVADLEAAGLITQFNKMKGDFQIEVRRALADLNTEGAAVRGGVEAVGIAKIMKKYMDATMNRKNQAGAYIKPRKGFTGTQMHNPRKIHKAGVDKWAQDHMEAVDFKAMRIPKADRPAFLTEMHAFLRRGEKIPDDLDGFDMAFGKGGNISKKLSQHRTIIYKSADAAGKMDDLYGHGSLRDQFMADLMMSSRAIALLDTLGDNPQQMVDTIVARLNNEYRGQDVKLDRIQDKRGRSATVKGLLMEVTGDINLGSQTTMALLGSNIRAWKTMSALGRVILSVPGDVAYGAANRMYQGQTVLGAWGDSLSAVFRGMNKKQKADLSRRMGIGMNGMIGDMQRGFGASDQLNGRMSKAMGLFFKLNFLNWWTDANQRGATYILANDLGLEALKGGNMDAKMAFDNVPESLRRVLHIYGIDAKKWEVARLAVEKMDDGNVYLMPDNIANVRGSVFTGMSQAQQAKLKTEVQESIYTLLTNEATISVVEPGAREMAMMRRGYRPDEAAGQAIRFMGQFKGFGVSVLSRVMGRQLYGTGSKTLREALGRGLGANLGLVNAVVGMTVLGYVSYQMKEVSKGREFREASPQMFIASMLQGGGLGIYGDFLFAEYNRFGGGPLGTAAGPVLGDAAELFKIIQKLQSDDPDVRGEVLRLVKRNVPFANLLYVKDAMDYLIWYQLQEMLNPGYLKRNERRVERENNQEYWLPPSSIVATGGGFR